MATDYGQLLLALEGEELRVGLLNGCHGRGHWYRRRLLLLFLARPAARELIFQSLRDSCRRDVLPQDFAIAPVSKTGKGAL